jgi:hypothetical protein
MKFQSVIRKVKVPARVLLLLMIAASFGMAAYPAHGASTPNGCSANPETRQLDYWLGDWSVGNPGSSDAGKSEISLSLDKCLFVERWGNGKGHTGENVFGYSADDKTWRALFADNEGRVHIFVEGTVASGSAEFHGPSRGPNGESFLNRVKIIRVSADKVEQIWEKSTDNGATWKTVFSGEYSRKPQ